MIVRTLLAAFLALLLAPAPAAAQIALNKVILDFGAGNPLRDDIEVTNTSDERLFVAVEPARVEHPGLADERRVRDRDPAALGLLVSPNRLVIEPRQRKLVRFAVIVPPERQDRIFRVTVKPVVGQLQAAETAVRVLIGYDVLVIARPDGAAADLVAERVGTLLKIRNAGNTNALLSRGRNCDPAGANCVDLPAKRIYPGATWDLPLKWPTEAEFYVSVGNRVTRERF